MPSNVWYKEPETVAAHYYILLRLFQCRFAYDRTLLLSFLRMVKRTCLPHTKPLSAPCLKRVSENWQLVKLIRLLVILLPSDVFSQRELLICFSRNEKSFASICTRNVQPTHLGNDSFDSISQFFSLSLLHFNSSFFKKKKKDNCSLTNSPFVYLQFLYRFMPFILCSCMLSESKQSL